MKYSAEVESEKRNKSPRNDLLRNRICVGIIDILLWICGLGRYDPLIDPDGES